MRAAGSDSARLDATRLFGAILGRDPAWFLAHDDDIVSGADIDRFEGVVERREAGEPVAYIVGYAGFYGRTFSVTRDVLVPRPETEELAERALTALRDLHVSQPTVLDLGTGSGALAITLACELPALAAIGTDISIAALAVAKRNAYALGVDDRTAFVEGDLLAAVRPGTRFHCVVANLPYVETRAIAAAPDPVSFEPRLALDGGPDGLDLYRRLFATLETFVAPGGFAFLEAGAHNAVPLGRLATEAFPAARVAVHHDYAGLQRIVEVRFPESPAPG